MTAQLERLSIENRKLTERNEELSRQIQNLQIMLFGPSSEKQPIVEENSKQLFFDFEGAKGFTLDTETDTKSEKSTTTSSSKGNGKKKKGGNQFILPEDLEVEEITLDIPEDEKSDPITGENFSQIDVEVSEKVVRVKASYKMIRILRPVYGAGVSGVIKADLPESVAGFSKIDESVWAESAVRRVCDHSPFNRQVQILARDGINLTRQSLNKTFLNNTAALRSLYLLLKQFILTCAAIHLDETTVKMQVPGKKQLGTAYLWVLCGSPPGHKGEPLVWMHFETNRRHENAEKIIEGYDKIVHSDAYEAYEKLADEGLFTWAICWVHARRYFIKATVNDFQKEVIKKFTTIMHVDNSADDINDNDRIKYRQKHVAPLVDELIEYLEENYLTSKVMISESLSKACAYFLKRKKYFKNFLNHAEAEMDNNAAERSIRPLKVGNKNWLFIGSPSGGEACAIMTSLLQSARNMGLNPQEYLENVLRRIPYTKKEDLQDLLPHRWEKKINPRSPFLPPDYKVF
jgi:hypothetical protein